MNVSPRARRRYELTFSPQEIGRRLMLVLEDVTGSDWLASQSSVQGAERPATVNAAR